MTLSSEAISIIDVFDILRRNILRFIFCILTVSIISYSFSWLISPKYKAKAVISIESAYFHFPLFNEFIAGPVETGEYRSLRESLIRSSLSNDFLDELGERYNIFKSSKDTNLRRRERAELLNAIEYYSFNVTNFQINIINTDPIVAYNMTKDVVSQILKTLAAERSKKLIHTRDVIQAQTQSLAPIASQAEENTEVEALKKEFENQTLALASLRSRYTDIHPDVIKKQAELADIDAKIKRKIEITPKSEQSDKLSNMFATSAAKWIIVENIKELLRITNLITTMIQLENNNTTVPYVEVIEEPSIPYEKISPRRAEFAIFGGAVGLFIALLLTTYYELKRSNSEKFVR